MSFDKLGKVRWDGLGGVPAKIVRGIGKGGMKACPSSICSDVEGLYRREFLNWNEYPTNVALVWSPGVPGRLE